MPYEEDPSEEMRDRIIGISEKSHRKSYYPQLKQRITDLEEALDALSESEERYRSLVENVNIGIFRSRYRDGGILDEVNTAFLRIFGYGSKDDIKNVLAKDLYEEPADRQRLIDMAESQGKVEGQTVIMKRTDGRTIIGSLSLTLIRDENGQPAFMEGVIEDITDKVMQQEALHQANRKLNLLSSITRHDIINQIIALKGFLSLMEREGPGERFDDLHMKVSRTVENIERQISFTKDYQEIGVKSPQWIQVNEAVFNSLMTVDKATINIHIDVGHYQIFADPMVTRVFYNLCHNAIIHSKAKNLYIGTEISGTDLVIYFQDDGVGIHRKELLFQRGNSRSGYGLFLSKEVLAITNIDIRETGKPGEGARFEVVVPHHQFRTY
ncbi:MAG: sensory histidine kinase AtoS [Methanomassiliicoccales archaeon PtaU1.Bin124]|nr:MAG: sensory histidine kinase AtoS [Methanomassiliicoccales archaeon PtaU1.Bin124]